MEWIKSNIVSLLISGYLLLATFIVNEKINELKATQTEVKEIREMVIDVREMVIEIKAKREADQSQKFDRYEEMLNDLQKKLEK